MTERSARVVVARKLTRRAGREKAGAFLAEGAQAVREALVAHRAGTAGLREAFTTAAFAERQPELVADLLDGDVRVHEVTERAAASLSETVTPQGVVTVCDRLDVPVSAALAVRPPLVAVLVGITDPGNAGTVLRVADAAGAGAVVFAGDSVDPFNGKAVRASTGSLFHLPIARERDVDSVLAACRDAGLSPLGADGHAAHDLAASEARALLGRPTAWVFGSEAHGLPDELVARLDSTVRVPIYGQAESLNLATAAAVCLYASAREQREPGGVRG
ncbi:TrmH family RNA methyltransferase [Allosaccharopolyspora coralli]|uniref:TrmH family RNA methyltransferase n=1 Tax=Allosaccharopolyspora coralli TaxID=2665642 RepID=UPI001E65913D|nr:RNA methyltransferase [Allosaccharopolyspora coralli]